MNNYKPLIELLNLHLKELVHRADTIEDELRHPLDANSSEQAIDLADDENSRCARCRIQRGNRANPSRFGAHRERDLRNLYQMRRQHRPQAPRSPPYCRHVHQLRVT